MEVIIQITIWNNDEIALLYVFLIYLNIFNLLAFQYCHTLKYLKSNEAFIVTANCWLLNKDERDTLLIICNCVNSKKYYGIPEDIVPLI